MPDNTKIWALALAALLATGPGSRCEDDWDCPPALTCSAGRCR